MAEQIELPLMEFVQQDQVRVTCNGVKGVFLVQDRQFACLCASCLRRGDKQGYKLFTPTDFERHAGMAASKKWKYSVRVDDPAYKSYGDALTIGRWLELFGDPGNLGTATGQGLNPKAAVISREAETSPPSASEIDSQIYEPNASDTCCHSAARGEETVQERQQSGLSPVRGLQKGEALSAEEQRRIEETTGLKIERFFLPDEDIGIRTRRKSFKQSAAYTSKDPYAKRRRVAVEEGLEPEFRQNFLRRCVAEEGPSELDQDEPASPKRCSAATLGMVSPATRKLWLSSEDEKKAAELQSHPAQVHLARKSSRLGPAFQANIPQVSARTWGARSGGSPPKDPRMGAPGPSLEEAQHISSALERAIAERLPRDATEDVHEEPRREEEQEPGGDAAPEAPDRGRRARRAPSWLGGEAGQQGPGAGREEPPPSGGGDGAGAAQEAPPPSADGGAREEGGAEGTLRVTEWALSEDCRQLAVTATLGEGSYSGLLSALDLLPRSGVPRGPRRPRTRRLQPPAGLLSRNRGASSEEAGASADAEQSEPPRGEAQANEELDEDTRPEEAALGPQRRRREGEAEDRAAAESPASGERGSQSPRSPGGGRGSPPPPPTAPDRRSKAEERFRCFADQGPPPGALCLLCQLEEAESDLYDRPTDGRQVQLSLGRLLPVRTSAVTHAWVHEECARWCPKAPKANGRQAEEEARLGPGAASEAVQRARRSKCTACGCKGAAIECCAWGCRRSFHLLCACVAGCLLQEETREAYCPDHAEVKLRQLQKEGKETRCPGKPVAQAG